MHILIRLDYPIFLSNLNFLTLVFLFNYHISLYRQSRFNFPLSILLIRSVKYRLVYFFIKNIEIKIPEITVDSTIIIGVQTVAAVAINISSIIPAGKTFDIIRKIKVKNKGIIIKLIMTLMEKDSIINNIF